MSKKIKKAQKDRRKLARLTDKAAKKALYAKFSDAGKIKGTKRSKGGKLVLVKDFKHQENNCGNLGCRRCFPMIPRNPSTFLAETKVLGAG